MEKKTKNKKKPYTKENTPPFNVSYVLKTQKKKGEKTNKQKNILGIH